MRQSTETSLAEPSKVELLAPEALGPDDRRHLTRFLTRHCAAVPLLDSCVEGYGPLPGLMDRFISRVVDIHRQLSGGTFVDAGDRLEVHPQSLRVLSRKVRDRDIGEGSILAGTPEDWVQYRWKATVSALLRGHRSFPIAQLAQHLAPWTGPVRQSQLNESLQTWINDGWLKYSGEDRVSLTGLSTEPYVSGRGTASIIADHLTDLSGMYLSSPMSKQGSGKRAHFSLTRGVVSRRMYQSTCDELRQHMRDSIDRARRKWHTTDPSDQTITIGLLLGPSSRGMQSYSAIERDIWLNALARHLARHGGLREAMPILYQEVARELRRRSLRRAYDVDLLKAVGRARQNVHEWEAGRGFHFRGPAPLTVVEDSPDSITEGKMRQYARVFLQERSQRACKIYEIAAWLQKEVGVKIEEQALLRILDDEVTMGAAKVVPDGPERAYQAVKSFRRTFAQNMAQRRANLEIVIRALSGLLAGAAAERPNYTAMLEMVVIKREHAADFAQAVFQSAADFHGQVVQRHPNLDPEDDDAIDVEISAMLAPTALVPDSPSR